MKDFDFCWKIVQKLNRKRTRNNILRTGSVFFLNLLMNRKNTMKTKFFVAETRIILLISNY